MYSDESIKFYPILLNNRRRREYTLKYFKKIIGERIYLSPINTEDCETYTKWLNDIEICENLGNYAQLLTIGEEKKWLEEFSSKNHNYAIVLHNGDIMIGNIGFIDIDNISRTGTVGLFIGDKEYHNKGYGTEALKLILNYAFKTLNLNNAMLCVHSNNERGIACYKKVGFKEIGRRREAKYIDGKYVDIVYMDIIAREYLS
jgi:RimJ/RimL family protein N-acetyltransferase